LVSAIMLTFDYSRISAPPPSMSNFVGQLLQWERDNPDLQLTPEAVSNLVNNSQTRRVPFVEKRNYQRIPMVAHVPAMPLDENNEPVGPPFMVMTRNISTVGISLIHSEAIDAKRLAIELQASSGGRIQLAVEVLRCQKLGDFYEIGGKLICKIGSSKDAK
jgi:hypothetical protein